MIDAFFHPKRMSRRARRSAGPVAVLTSIAALLSALPAGAFANAPVNTVAPTVSGTARVTQTLTAGTGTWSGTPSPTFSYQWQQCGQGSPTASTLAASGSAPRGIAVDSSGNVYTANFGATTVTKITPAGVSSTLGSAASNPNDLAVDSAGNVYTANYSANSVTKITPAGVASTLGTTGTNPYGIAVDSGGNVYTANSGANNVTKITPAGVSSTLGTTGSSPKYIALDSAGNVYTSNGAGNVTKITPAGVSSTLGTTGTNPYGIAVDSSGNVYTANQGSNSVTKITPAGVSSTLGTTGTQPWGIALDPAGNVYTANYGSNNVTKITPAGVSSTLGATGSGPVGIAADPGGSVYTANATSSNVTKFGLGCTDITGATSSTYTAQVADYQKYLRVKVTGSNGVSPNGVAYSPVTAQVTASAPSNSALPTTSGTAQVGQTLTAAGGTWSGIPSPTFSYQWQQCGGSPSGPSTLGTTSTQPRGIALDSAGNVYTANYSSNNVTKITPAGVSSTLGTTGTQPNAIALDSAGNVYTANEGSNNVTKITPGGVSSTLGTTGAGPRGIALDSAGNVYTSNFGAASVTKITPAGVSSTLASTGTQPNDIVLDPAGNLYTANYGSNNVTKITSAGVSSTLGTTGSQPVGIAIDSAGNVYTANYAAVSVTKITPAGVSSTLGTTGTNPYRMAVDETGNVYTANYGGASVTKITPAGVSSSLGSTGTQPFGIVLDSAGNLYTANAGANNVTKFASSCTDITGATSSTYTAQVADYQKFLRVKVTATNGISPNGVAYSPVTAQVTASAPTNTTLPTTSGTAQVGQTLTAASGLWSGIPAVSGYSYQWQRCGDTSPAPTTLGTTGSGPWHLAVDSSGNVYTANWGANTVTKITPAGVSSTFASVNTPIGVAVDSSNNVYVANWTDNNVTKITPGGTATILGTTGTNPRGIAVDSAGNVYTANYNANTVTKITPGGTSTTLGTTGANPWRIAVDSSGNVYTANFGGSSATKITPAGVSTNFTTGASPLDITVDSAGNAYTANWGANNVTKISTLGTVTTLGTTGTNPYGVVVDLAGNVYTANSGSNNVTKITPAGVSSTLGSTGTNPQGIAIDAAGNLYTNNYNANTVTKFASSCTDITGATSQSYSPQAADIQQTLRVKVTATNGISPDGVAYSARSSQVTGATTSGSVSLPSSLSTGTGSWVQLSSLGTTPSAASFTGTVRAIAVASNATVKVATTTGVTQATGYSNWTTGASEIAFYGSLADVNSALATLSVKGTATGSGSVSVYVTPNSCGAYNPATDHYYEKKSGVSTSSWSAARTYAQSQSCNGLGGYLTSLDSAAEQNFHTSKVSTDGVLGGRNSGGWKWFDGPAGVNGTSVTYSGWCSGEPNGNGNTMYQSSSRGGCWDDDADWSTPIAMPILIEYGGIAGHTPSQQASATMSLSVDGTAPTASWSTVPSTPTNADPLAYTLTFSKAITDLTSADFTNTGTATGCTFTPASSSGTVINVSVSGCSTSGTVIARLAANSVSDSVGNLGPTALLSASTVTLDRTAPTVTWGSAPASPSNSASLTFPITFSESVSGIAAGDFSNAGTATGCSFAPSAASGTSINVVVTGCSDGTVQPRIAAASVSDSAGNTAPATALNAGSVTYDRTAPTATWGSSPSSPTNASSLTFPLSFSESVSGIAAADFSNAGSATGCTFAPSATSGTSINVVVTGCSEGTVQPRLAAGGVTDALGNTGPAAASNGPTVTRDLTAPTATWGSSPSSPTNASSLTFPLSFSETVTGIAGSDFTNVGTATGCSFAPSASSGSSINVVAAGCSEGTVQPRLAAGGVSDAAGNTGPASAATASSVTVDRTAPTVTWGSAPSSPTNASSLTFPISFSESVSGIAAGDFSNAGTATGCVFTPSAASGTSINVVVTGCSEGTVQLQLASGAVSDSAGNTGPATITSSGTVTVDRTAPTASWTSPPTSPTNATSVTFAVSFSEMVTGLAAGDFSNSGTATGCTFTPGASSGTLISVVASGCSEGTLIPVLQGGAVTDLGGNAGPGTPVTSAPITIDRTAPTAAFTSVPASPNRASSLTWQLTFSESVSGISAGDFSNAGTATGCQFAVSASAGASVTITATGCSEGTVELRIASGSVTDGANTGPASAVTASSVNVDRTAPALPTISGLPSSTSSSTSETAILTGGEPGLTWECSLDGAAWAPCTSPVSLTGLAEGGHGFRARSTDAAGNVSPVASRNWEVDLTPPNLVPTATGMPSGTTSSTTLNPTLTGEAGNTLQCRLDGGSWVTCASLLPVSGLADGTHTLESRQQDPAGNNGPVASWVWAVDTAPPATPPSAGGGPSITSDSTPTFTFTGDAGNTFECRVDGGSWAPCTSPFTTPTLADGTHTVEMRQVDGAGNPGPPVTRTITVDTSAPAEVGVSGIPNSPTNSRSASLTLTGESGSTIECQVDGGAWVSPCPAPLILSGLAEGDHVVVVRQRDAANNLSPTTTVRWSVDLTPPSYAPGVVGRPDLSTNSTSAAFNLNAVAPDTLQCRLDGGSWGPCPSPLQYSGLADGAHTLEARAVDPAGNAGPVSTVNWTVDRSPPASAPSILDVPSGTVGNNSADVSFGVDPGTTAQCSLDGAAWSACVSPLSLTGLADGSHTLRIRMRDAAGNTGPESSSTWTVDTTGPAAPDVTGSPTGTVASSSLNVSFTGEPGGSFECQLDSGVWAACTSPYAETGLADGAHVFKVRQIDAVGNTGTARTVSWTVDTTAPGSAPARGSGPADGSSITDSTPTFEFSGAGAGEGYQCRVDGGAWTACTSPDTLPELSLGSHTFDVRIIDAAGNTGPATSTRFDVVAPPAPDSEDRPRLVDSTPVVSSEGDVQTRVACDSPAPCRVTLNIIIGGTRVAAGSATVPAGQTGTVPVQLPESLQARLAREGSITITVRSVIEVEGSRVETETSFRITAPPARAARNWRVKPNLNGDALFTATCEGTLSSRCDGTLTLYDASTLDSGAASAAASKRVVVATAKLAGPSGKPMVVTAKLNAEGKKRLRKRGFLKIRPLVEFTGATASGQPAEYRINAMTTARWIRAALSAVESGGDVRRDLNLLLDRARGGSVSFSDAERTMVRNIIPRRERTLRAVQALPREPSNVRGARSLAICSMSRSLAAGQEYRRYFATGSYRRYVRGSVHSYRATGCKDRFLARIRDAGAKAGVRVPYPNGLWP